MFVFLVVLTAIFAQSHGQCNVNKYLVTNEVYNIYSPNYPNKYGAYQNCFYQFSAPENHYITINCNINTPNTPNCAQDKLSVSISGNPNMQDSKILCGYRTYLDQSWDNLLNVGFYAYNSPGGIYFCSVMAIKTTCKCGWKKTVRIVGGSETLINEFPMMAGLFDTYDDGILCGATIISKQYLVTAAHCLINRNTGNTYVKVGEHDLRITTESTATQSLQIASMKAHEGFTTTLQQNDIALVKTVKNIIYSGLVGPACLPYKFQSSDYTGVSLTTLGWGSTAFGEQTSPVLKKTNLIAQSQPTCEYYYPNRITTTQFCTYAQGTDSCQSDSGGPLLYYDPSSFSTNIFGIISYGKLGCATNNPAVNTNVAKFIRWIEINTQASFCTV